MFLVLHFSLSVFSTSSQEETPQCLGCVTTALWGPQLVKIARPGPISRWESGMRPCVSWVLSPAQLCLLGCGLHLSPTPPPVQCLHLALCVGFLVSTRALTGTVSCSAGALTLPCHCPMNTLDLASTPSPYGQRWGYLLLARPSCSQNSLPGWLILN